MDFKSLPSSEELHQLLIYDPDDGSLVWRERTSDMFNGKRRSPEANCRAWNTRFAGKPAGHIDAHGYSSTFINGTPFRAHRLVWVIHYGRSLDGQIDHINGDRADNRIVNLRVVTSLENSHNAKRSKTNTSGSTGVSWHIRGKCWRAIIGPRYLGLFATFEDAVAARNAAEIELGFHPNHGRR